MVLKRYATDRSATGLTVVSVSPTDRMVLKHFWQRYLSENAYGRFSIPYGSNGVEA